MLSCRFGAAFASQRGLLSLLGAAALSLLLPGPVSAAYYEWSYSGVGVEASGTFTTDPLDPGTPNPFSCTTCGTADGYVVTSITGERNGQAITGLDPINAFVGNDNLIYNSEPLVDWAGISYDVGDQHYNIYFAGWGWDNALSPIPAYGECSDQTQMCSDAFITAVDFTAVDPPAPESAPEPSSLALLASALGAIAIGRRRRTQLT